jgi:Nickel responsive protein SCO4226-like
MKYFIDTHDKTKGSFPQSELTEEQFFEQFADLEKAAEQFGVFGHAAHVNLKEGKAFCFMSGPDEEAVRKAHAAIDLPYDSITEVRRVTGADMRMPQPAGVPKRKVGVG